MRVGRRNRQEYSAGVRGGEWGGGDRLGRACTVLSQWGSESDRRLCSALPSQQGTTLGVGGAGLLRAIKGCRPFLALALVAPHLH